MVYHIHNAEKALSAEVCKHFDNLGIANCVSTKVEVNPGY